MTSISLEIINHRTFESAHNLLEIYMDTNQLRRKIPDNAFTGAIRLKVLSVTINHFQEIGEKSLCGLPRLERLLFYRNKLQKIHPKAFRDLKNLVVLGLNENLLEILPKDLFANNPKLRELYLNSNRLQYIEKATFTPLKSLYRLEIPASVCVNLLAQSGVNLNSLEQTLGKCHANYLAKMAEDAEELDNSHCFEGKCAQEEIKECPGVGKQTVADSTIQPDTGMGQDSQTLEEVDQKILDKMEVLEGKLGNILDALTLLENSQQPPENDTFKDTPKADLPIHKTYQNLTQLLNDFYEKLDIKLVTFSDRIIQLTNETLMKCLDGNSDDWFSPEVASESPTRQGRRLQSQVINRSDPNEAMKQTMNEMTDELLEKLKVHYENLPVNKKLPNGILALVVCLVAVQLVVFALIGIVYMLIRKSGQNDVAKEIELKEVKPEGSTDHPQNNYTD